MKRKVLFAAGMILCLVFGGCGKAEPTAYEKGEEQLAEENYEKAIEYFQTAAKTDRDAVRALRGMGIAWTEQGVFDKAEEAFSEALSLAQGEGKAMRLDLRLYLADAQYQQEKYEECIASCTELLEIKKLQDAYFLRGSAYLHRDEYRKASDNFSKVVSGSKDYEDYLDIYRVYSQCGMNADGQKYLESALKISAREAEDFYNRGRIYYYLEEYSEAEAELKKALKEGDMEAAVYLGKVYMAEQNIQSAQEMFEKAVQEEGTEAAGYNGLAYCAAANEDYEKALEYVEKGLSKADSGTEQALRFNQIVFYEHKGDFASAKTKISEYLELYPADEAAVRENYFLQTR